MKKTEIIKRYVKYLDKKGSARKLKDERKHRLQHLFDTLWKDETNRNTLTYKEIDRYLSWIDVQFNSKVTIIAGIKSFVRFCNLQNQLRHLHSDGIILPKMEIKEARYLTRQEILTILKESTKKDLYLRTAILLLATTGARIHEICNITKEQLKNAILVQDNYQISIIWKRKIKRPLFISKKAYSLCNKLVKVHGQDTVIWLKKNSLATKIRKFSREINIKFSAHAFRHSFITDLAKQWANIYIISKLAWHTNINTTNKYLHSADCELSNTVNMLSYRK